MTELETLRHSCAHVLATAILKIWPEAQFAAGPPVENGFYYDLELPHRITPEDFARIEEEMKKEIKANNRFERIEVSREEAIAMAERGELAALGGRTEPSKFKLDIVQHIPDGEVITIYRNGQFTDLCAGPHVSHTGRIGAFKLTNLASAYYKGDERNPQLQRVYGTAFKNKTEMEAYFTMLEEAKKRDHRKIGREMELFCFDEDVGPGLPLWLPKGTVLVEELERLAKETEFAAGYQRVRTPHIARESMYKCSGHLPYYADSMFPPMEFSEEEGGDSVKYYLKAMNCPHHHKLFGAVQRSYRDLPLRLAEYGACYRYEQSGELFGLMRVRSMQMNDAHIYCTEDQFEQEFRAVNEMYLKYFKIFGIDKYVMRFSTHDPAKLGQKFVDQPELWKKTEDMVRNVLIRSGINYVEVPNEAAFYGPKIDVQVWSAIGREFTIATNQVDFAVPARFGLTYKDRDNTEKTPLCIHRAPLGTHERFIGFLIEHYAGNFPLWLAPEQVRVMTIGDEDPLVDAAKDLHAELRSLGIRAELDISSDKINGKIQRAEQAKVHTMLVIGKRDLEAGAVSVREHGKGNLGAKPRAEVVTALADAIKNRA
ncbi:threonyl-tRNA synthetase [Terrimicrobium sacchariphilum]|uniref:Threonine--tRNA ligase n=1 Tax=Terrimicrobium sacchariphilum TaxID=690879 RepID=A0A146G959_TERSA|nr:threonine--tRNA ligase [Terrimicrobium sacchariphilum]GAT34215.1 threonyl-tRNA synthetase [Terrimicrobium sacchariphilum]